jgi:hypothetical protein
VETRNTDFVAIGWFVQNRLSDRETSAGESVFQIDRFVYRHPLFQFRSELRLPRYVGISADQAPQAYLIFGEIHKGEVEVYRGEPIASPAAVGEYLAGLLAIDWENLSARIGFCFSHVVATDAAIAADALLELNNLSPQELIASSRDLDHWKVHDLLANPTTKADQLGILALLLAGCGKEQDVQVVRKLIDRIEGRKAPGAPEGQVLSQVALIDSVLIAYTAMAPAEGFAAIHRIVADPKRDFAHRYAALRALRHLRDNPIKPIDGQAVINAVVLLLDQGDICDLAMEDLRRWQRWELTGKVISYYGRETHAVPIVKRAILRFALNAPDNAVARAFVSERRLEDPERVRETEELLELEPTPPQPQPKK